MSEEQIIKISDDYWNIRGIFKAGGVLNIGTHASLVKRTNKNFVLLDAYTLKGDVKAKVDTLTNNGEGIEAIINLHPFHTIHVRKAHEQYPNARLYGTRRHLDKFPELPWQPELTESSEFAELFREDFEFSIPAGVDFISNNENHHFSSVLAFHKASKTIHVDDTFMYLEMPGLLSKIKKPEITFHMTLPKTLEKRVGAVKEFRSWAIQLTENWGEAENLCAAHSATLLGSENKSASIANRILTALENVEKILQKHEDRFG